MTIAVVHNLGTGGARRALREHLVGLKARGHRLTLYASRASEQYEPLAPLCDSVTLWGPEATSASDSVAGGDTGRVRRLARQVLGENLYEQIRDTVWTGKQRHAAEMMEQEYTRLADTVLADAPDLVYVHQCQMLLVPRTLLARLAGRVPVVFYLNDTLRRVQEWAALSDTDYDAPPGRLRRRELGRVFSPAFARFRAYERERYEQGLHALANRTGARLLVNSYFSRESILRTSGIEGDVCYFGVDTQFFTPPDPDARRAHEVLSVGALRPEKRHERVIAAIATIPAIRRPTLRIVGYYLQSGDPYAAHLQQVAHNAGVSLTLDAEVSDDALRTAYRQAAVAVFTPYLEPFGLVPLEAMACETPVVAIAEGGPRETVRDGENGLLTGGTPVEIGTAIDYLLQHPDQTARFGKTGREDALTRWSWDRSLDTLEQHFAQARQERMR